MTGKKILVVSKSEHFMTAIFILIKVGFSFTAPSKTIQGIKKWNGH